MLEGQLPGGDGRFDESANQQDGRSRIDATANEQRAAVRANRTYRALGRIAKDM